MAILSDCPWADTPHEPHIRITVLAGTGKPGPLPQTATWCSGEVVPFSE